MADPDLVLEHIRIANQSLVELSKILQSNNENYSNCIQIQTKLIDALQSTMETFQTEILFRASLETGSKLHIEERFFRTKEQAEKWVDFYASSFTVEAKYNVDICKVLKLNNIYIVLNPKYFTKITTEMIDIQSKSDN